MRKQGQSYKLKIAQGIAQADYVDWKYKYLKRLCQTTQPPKEEIYKSGKKGKFFCTTSGKYLKDTYDLFYIQDANGKMVKTITQKLIDSLPMHPLVLATFYMDDGSVRKDCYSGKLATQGFKTKHESELICQYLAKWNVKGTVAAHDLKKDQYYVNLSTETFGVFIDIVKPYIDEVPVLIYKLNEDRNKTP